MDQFEDAIRAQFDAAQTEAEVNQAVYVVLGVINRVAAAKKESLRLAQIGGHVSQFQSVRNVQPPPQESTSSGSKRTATAAGIGSRAGSGSPKKTANRVACDLCECRFPAVGDMYEHMWSYIQCTQRK